MLLKVITVKNMLSAVIDSLFMYSDLKVLYVMVIIV